MLRQIKLLLKLQMINLCGLNEARHAADKKQKLRLAGMAALYGLLALFFCGYVGLMCYVVAKAGMGALAPLLLAVALSLVTLVFTALKAGGVLFDLNSYERLIAMPLRPTAIIVSRFLTMYFFDAALSLAALLPAAIVCGVVMRPAFSFYPMMLLGALVLPLIPMTVAMLLGGGIYALSARMRHKNLAVILLSLLGTFAVMGASFFAQTTKLDAAMLTNLLDGLFDRLAAVYPPAGWFARCVNGGNMGGYALLALGSAAFFALAAALIGRHFSAICTLLGARASRRNYTMTAQRQRSVASALYRREIRRYFASATYVLNTSIGALMVVLLCAAVRLWGAREPAMAMMLSMREAKWIISLFLGLMFLISPSTCCSISMEGKQLWRIQSLPVSARQIYGAKMMVSFTLSLPCWALGEILLLGALNLRGAEAAALLLIPLAYILYGAALGLWINLKSPMLNWESERQPVKQSKAVMLTMILGFASVLIPGAAMLLLPDWATAIGFALAALLLALAALLWRKCVRTPLAKIV